MVGMKLNEDGSVWLNTERPFLEIRRPDATVDRWEYDIVTVRYKAEELERSHGLIQQDRILPPSPAMLDEFAAWLREQGLEGCTPAIAFGVHRLVRAQFLDMMAEIDDVTTAIYRRDAMGEDQ